jgi:hypothetical protein
MEESVVPFRACSNIYRNVSGGCRGANENRVQQSTWAYLRKLGVGFFGGRVNPIRPAGKFGMHGDNDDMSWMRGQTRHSYCSSLFSSSVVMECGVGRGGGLAAALPLWRIVEWNKELRRNEQKKRRLCATMEPSGCKRHGEQQHIMIISGGGGGGSGRAAGLIQRGRPAATYIPHSV